MIANELVTLEYARGGLSRRSKLSVIALLVCLVTSSYCALAYVAFLGLLRIPKTEFALGALMGVGAIPILSSSLLVVTFVTVCVVDAARGRRYRLLRFTVWILIGVLQSYSAARAFDYFDELLKRAI